MTEGVLASRIALVTGASRGIGAAIAEALAAAGAQPILVARTQGGLEATDDRIRAAGGTATLIPLDLTEADHIDRMAAAIFERFGKLDILIGNAGTLGGGLYPVGHIPPERLDQAMALNFTANWRLMRACDSLLRLSDAGRAVFTTCGQSAGIQPYWGAYAASKAALEAMVRAYAGETSKTPLRINMVDPGPVATKLRMQAFPGEDQATLPKPEAVAPLFVDLASPECRRHGQVLRFA